MDRHRGKSPPFLDREDLEKFLHGLLKGQLKRDIPLSAVDELKDLSGLWDFGNTQELIKQPQHRLDRDGHRKLIRNVNAVIELWTHRDYIEKSQLSHASDVRKALEKQPPRKLPFSDAECSLAVTYQTLEAIAHLPAPRRTSTKPLDFKTPRLGRDNYRKLIRNVKAVLIELRTHKVYVEEALPFHASDLSKPRDNHPAKNLVFLDPACSLAVTYQTLGAIAELPGPGDRVRQASEDIEDGLGELRQNQPAKKLCSPDPKGELAQADQNLEAIAGLPASDFVKPPDFATPRDGLIVALGAWWRKHVRRKPSAVNNDSPFLKLCRYVMTDKTLGPVDKLFHPQPN